MIKKNKKPEAVFTPDGFFVSVTAVRRMIKEAAHHINPVCSFFRFEVSFILQLLFV